jgi:hypothetical protein
LLVGCGSSNPPPETAVPGVIFTSPVDAQLDVPVGARLVVAFSDPVVASALGQCTAQGGEFCLVGPSGPVNAMPEVATDGKSVSFTGLQLDEAASYQLYVGPGLAPFAKNLAANGALVTFTTRGARPRAAAPTLVAVNGGSPTQPDSFRPMLDTSTIRLVFSEPLDAATVALAPGSIQLLDGAGAEVPATLLVEGIHVSIDPKQDLTGGATYRLMVGSSIVDLGGQALAPATVMLTPRSTGSPIANVLRTRVAGDPGTKAPRTTATPNQIEIDTPLIGSQSQQLLASTVATELGDPQALQGPIAFTIRKGARLHASGLSVALGGAIPIGVDTGDIEIELLSDGGGRIFRNPHQSPDQQPENDRAPLYVDLSMDVAVYAVDPTGNAVLSQTILGVQGSGIATATDGVLDIETVVAMDLRLLGVTSVSSNMVLELITDAKASAAPDTTPPQLIATSPDPAPAELPIDTGIELIFDEPVDVARAAAGGVTLQDVGGRPVASTIESHGASLVVRPNAPLAYSTGYQVVLSDVVDLAGNALSAPPPIQFATPDLAGTNQPMTIVASHPGAPCALAGGDATTPGRCAGGQSGDDVYAPFALAANEPLEVTFSQALRASSAVRGTQCNSGSVRVEQLDASGACVNAVPGTLLRRDRSISFVPDQPWTPGTPYRLTLVPSGSNACNALCGPAGTANFQPLNGTGNAGGPNAVFAFTGAPATGATYMVTTAAPFSDINGSGTIDSIELDRDENRVALDITGTSGSVSSASFNGTDCLTSRPGNQACIYLSGELPVEMQPVQNNCTLPDGSSAASCMPVAMTAGAMYGTSISMTANVVVGITTDTGMAVMRIRAPAAGGPPMGYIVALNGTPTLVASLELYMDAPDMSLPLGATHDLHSKPLTIAIAGPLTVLHDGRIAIAASNVADVPLVVNIDAPIVGQGSVQMVVPAGEMHLQLLSPPLRGGHP